MGRKKSAINWSFQINMLADTQPPPFEPIFKGFCGAAAGTDSPVFGSNWPPSGLGLPANVEKALKGNPLPCTFFGKFYDIYLKNRKEQMLIFFVRNCSVLILLL